MTTIDAQPNILKLNSPHLRSSASLEGVEVLMGLGLSGRQARVYLALLRFGEAKAKLIADRSVVERQEVYRLLDSLSEMGLVKRSISVPASFVPTPLSEGVRLLLQQKTSHITILRQQTSWLIERYRGLEVFPKVAEVKADFGSVYEADRGKKYLKAIRESQKSILAVTSWRRFKQLCMYFENPLLEALKRGVVMRFVIEKPLNHRLPKWVKVALVRFPNFKVKVMVCGVGAGVVVFDGVLVGFAFDPQSSVKRGPDLWSGHGGLVAVCRGYFEGQWGEG